MRDLIAHWYEINNSHNTADMNSCTAYKFNNFVSVLIFLNESWLRISKKLLTHLSSVHTFRIKFFLRVFFIECIIVLMLNEHILYKRVRLAGGVSLLIMKQLVFYDFA